MQPESQSLVLSCVGSDQPGFVEQLAEYILETGCSIVDSRMIALGSEFAVITQVDGAWNALAKLEQRVVELESKLDIKILIKRTGERAPEAKLLPYAVEVVALDQPGIVYNLANFFASRKINISELVTSRYAAPHTGTAMFAVNLHVHIPADVKLSSLREDFMVFCDSQNLDALLEPAK